jgi:Restriction Enzyme Adenine Methylase Associated
MEVARFAERLLGETETLSLSTHVLGKALAWLHGGDRRLLQTTRLQTKPNRRQYDLAVPLFEIDSTEGKLVPFSLVRGGADYYEHELEELAWQNPDEFFGESLLRIARRPKVTGGGIPDIVALNRDSHVTVIEVKRELDRAQLAQGLEYAGWARATTLDELSGIYHRGRHQFWEDWQSFTGSSSPLPISPPPQLYLVARRFYGRTESAYEFLSEGELPVHLIRASLYEDHEKKRRFAIVDSTRRQGPAAMKFSLGDLVEAGLLEPGQELIWHQPQVGATHSAVLKDTGELELSDGRTFASPSGAAQAIAGTPINGWAVWKAKGESLDQLRTRLAAESASGANPGVAAG